MNERELPDKVEVGTPFVIALAPRGEFPQIVDGKEVVQIVDDEAINALVANFEKAQKEAEAAGRRFEVLVDADHSSETSTNTEAMAWVTKVYNDPEQGLMAELDPTPLGAEKINGKQYRFYSGAWTLDENNRPNELVSIGLTNKPNLPVAPILNMRAVVKNPTAGSTVSNAETTAVTQNQEGEGETATTGETKEQHTDEVPVVESQINNNPNENQGTLNMDIRAKLGLAPEATDEEVEIALDAVLAKCGGMEQVQNALGLEPTTTNEEVVETLNAVITQCGEMQQAQDAAEEAAKDAAADEFVAQNEDIIPEEMTEEVKSEYVEDPAKAEATVANMRRVAAKAVLNAQNAHRNATRVINAASARVPEVMRTKTALNSQGGFAACKTPEEQNAWIRAHA